MLVFTVCVHMSLLHFLPPVSPEGSVLSPSPVLVNQTNNITLTCTSMGGPDNMYQWFHGGILLPGGTTPTLTLNDVRASDEGDYMCRVSNVAGDGSSSSTVTGELCGLLTLQKHSQIFLCIVVEY